MFPMWKSFIFRKPAPKRLITFCVGGLVESDFPEFIGKTVIEQRFSGTHGSRRIVDQSSNRVDNDVCADDILCVFHNRVQIRVAGNEILKLAVGNHEVVGAVVDVVEMKHPEQFPTVRLKFADDREKSRLTFTAFTTVLILRRIPAE